ncbi:MAG: cold shock domain-containing protein [Syntrophobacteraceae bacterium]
MAEGTVIWFSPKKGCGFIQIIDKSDIFFHRSEIRGDHGRFLRPGEKVTFDIVTNAKGLEAVNVRKVRAPDPADLVQPGHSVGVA